MTRNFGTLCRSPILRVAAVLLLAIWLSACTSAQQTVGGWFGSATPTPAPRATGEGPRTYYAGVAGLTVYAEASTSSKVVGQLALHEQVLRTKLVRGYAYVEAPASKLKGWVVNAQLIWRLPKASGTPAPEAAPPAGAEAGEAPAAGEADSAVEEPQAPAPTQEAVPEPQPTATAAVPVAPRRPKPTPNGPAPSIFDAY